MRVPYSVVTLDQLFSACSNKEPLFVDTETIGFYGEVRSLQAFQESWDEVLIAEWPDPMLTAAKLACLHQVWYNAHYDITTLQQQTETRFIPRKVDCCFLLSRLHYADKPAFSLDSVLEYALGYDPYRKQGLDKKVLQKSDWKSKKLTNDQLTYAATDVYYMPDIWDQCEYKREDVSYKLDMHTLFYCLDFQWNGMPVDDQKLFTMYEEIEEEINNTDMPINVNSYKKVREYIGSDKSDDLGLAELALNGNERAKSVRRIRKLTKQISFLNKFENGDGVILGKFKPSARSGRLTSNDQNLQQIPRATKRVFGYPEDAGKVLIYADYAQVELRTIAAITNCVKMIQLFREGVDLHGYTAQHFFGEGWGKHERQIAKTYNFNLVYGGGIAMMQAILLKDLNIFESESNVAKAKKKWQNMWREIAQWQQKGIANWRKNKLGSTPLGRQYAAKMMTDQLNIENQGAAAEVAKFALHYFYPNLHEEVVLNDFIHDSFILSAPNDPAIYEPAAKFLAECMQEAWFEMSKLFQITDVPMPVNVKVGYNWADIEDDDVEDIWSYDLEPYEMLEKVNANSN